MIKELLEYLTETGADYETETALLEEESIPTGMIEFYSNIKKADFPFGRIYSVKDALLISQRKPFEPSWFVFGQDNYSSFWLCRREPDEEGRQFTYWDHDAGIDIDEPVWINLLQFLKRIEESTKEFEEEWDDEYEEEWEE